jgi:hypothetical protein
MHKLMKIETELRRRDLILFNLALIPRTRSTYITIVLIAVGAFIYLCSQNGIPVTKGDWLVALIGSIGGGIGGMVGGTIFSILFIVVSSSTSNGVLGTHQFEISPDGLKEKTVANEGLNKWCSIQEVRTVGPFLFFKVSAFQFHIIPTKSFENEKALLEFENTAKDLRREYA